MTRWVHALSVRPEFGRQLPPSDSLCISLTHLQPLEGERLHHVRIHTTRYNDQGSSLSKRTGRRCVRNGKISRPSNARDTWFPLAIEMTGRIARHGRLGAPSRSRRRWRVATSRCGWNGSVRSVHRPKKKERREKSRWVAHVDGEGLKLGRAEKESSPSDLDSGSSLRTPPPKRGRG